MRRHQMEHFPRYWPIVRGIHRSPVNSPHKSQWRRALMFSLICAWTNRWVNHREACDFGTPWRGLWRHCNVPCTLCTLSVVSIICHTSFFEVTYPNLSINQYSLRWRHNGLDSVPNHQPHDCLLNRSFGHISKKSSKLRVTGLYVGNSPVTGEFPAQMASNAENVSIWWQHHARRQSSEPNIIW